MEPVLVDGGEIGRTLQLPKPKTTFSRAQCES